MDTVRIAYLSRYLFLIFLAVGTLTLLRHALSQLRARIRLRAAPLSGYFLLTQPDPSWQREQIPLVAHVRRMGGRTLLRLPLYPVTHLGSGKNADLRFILRDCPQRAAVFYRDLGYWYVRPAGREPLFVQGERIESPCLLHTRDEIQVGSLRFTFVDERAESALVGLPYNEEQADIESGHSAALFRAAPTPEARLALAHTLSRRGPWLPWITLNLFLVLSYLLQYLLFPNPNGGWLEPIAIWQVGIGLVLNTYFLFLPLTTPQFDRATFLALAHLLLLGNLVQFRLHLVHRSQIEQARVTEDWQTYSDLLNYVVKEFLTQNKAMVLGLILFPIVYWVLSRTRLADRMLRVGLVVTPLLYILTLILGRDPGGAHGARLWLQIGSFSLQLTEFAKISYLLVLAAFFKIRPRLRTQLLFAGWALLVFFLIMLLPDLGSLMILLPTTLVVYVILTSEYLQAAGIVLSGAAVSSLAYAVFPHVRKRLDGWRSLWSEVNAGNEQIVFGLRAVGRGGLLGRGIGNGSPQGVPEAMGDMVYSVLIEEWGLLVGILILVLFLVVWLRSVYIASESEDRFTGGFALGIATLFFVEALVVIGGATGLIPLTGATLPFIAKGGSSLLAKLLLAACLLGLSGRANRYDVARYGAASVEEWVAPTSTQRR